MSVKSSKNLNSASASLSGLRSEQVEATIPGLYEWYRKTFEKAGWIILAIHKASAKPEYASKVSAYVAGITRLSQELQLRLSDPKNNNTIVRDFPEMIKSIEELKGFMSTMGNSLNQAPLSNDDVAIKDKSLYGLYKWFKHVFEKFGWMVLILNKLKYGAYVNQPTLETYMRNKLIMYSQSLEILYKSLAARRDTSNDLDVDNVKIDIDSMLRNLTILRNCVETNMIQTPSTGMIIKSIAPATVVPSVRASVVPSVLPSSVRSGTLLDVGSATSSVGSVTAAVDPTNLSATSAAPVPQRSARSLVPTVELPPGSRSSSRGLSYAPPASETSEVAPAILAAPVPQRSARSLLPTVELPPGSRSSSRGLSYAPPAAALDSPTSTVGSTVANLTDLSATSTVQSEIQPTGSRVGSRVGSLRQESPTATALLAAAAAADPVTATESSGTLIPMIDTPVSPAVASRGLSTRVPVPSARSNVLAPVPGSVALGSVAQRAQSSPSGLGVQTQNVLAPVPGSVALGSVAQRAQTLNVLAPVPGSFALGSVAQRAQSSPSGLGVQSVKNVPEFTVTESTPLSTGSNRSAADAVSRLVSALTTSTPPASRQASQSQLSATSTVNSPLPQQSQTLSATSATSATATLTPASSSSTLF